MEPLLYMDMSFFNFTHIAGSHSSWVQRKFSYAHNYFLHPLYMPTCKPAAPVKNWILLEVTAHM